MDGREYCWANPDVQPWGNVLPPQCEKCFSFRPWGKKAVGLGGVPSSISFACGGEFKGKKCTMVKTFHKPEKVTLLPRSDWLWYPWPRA
jgi:hypothetical protein